MIVLLFKFSIEKFFKHVSNFSRPFKIQQSLGPVAELAIPTSRMRFWRTIELNRIYANPAEPLSPSNTKLPNVERQIKSGVPLESRDSQGKPSVQKETKWILFLLFLKYIYLFKKI